MQKYVTGFAFHKDDYNLVALIEKQRPERQKGKLNGIGGKVEKLELDINAMVREFEEETSMKTEAKDWHTFITLLGADWMVRFYRSFSLDINNIKTSTDEEVHIIRVSSLKLKRIQILDNNKWLIPLALDTKMHYGTINYG